MTLEILELMEERKLAKNIPAELGTERYKELKNKVQNECRKAKEKFLNEECREIERLQEINSAAYHKKKSKNMHHKKGRKFQNASKENGEEIYDNDEILQRWKEYCEKLYGDEQRRVIDPTPIEEKDIPQFTNDDITSIIKNLHNNKTPGSDGIPVEFLKLLTNEGISYIVTSHN